MRPLLDSSVAVAERSARSLVVFLTALLLTTALFSIFVLCVHSKPILALHEIMLGAFGTSFSWQNTLEQSAPLLLTALCTALPARAGLVIIGNEGALVLGGLAAAAAAHFFAHDSSVVGIAAMVLASMVTGGIWILLAGLLRYFRGVNETISSLVLNYIAIAFFKQLVEGPLRDPASLNNPSTFPISPRFAVGMIGNSQVDYGFLAGVIVCILMYLLMLWTPFGFGTDISGGNPRAARLAGLPVGRIVMYVCFLGGAAAGLAGYYQVAAVQGRANDSLIAGYGYAGILVAFMARQNPLAVIPVAILLGGIMASNDLLQMRLGLPDSTVYVLQGILFVAILASESFYGDFRLRPARKKVANV